MEQIYGWASVILGFSGLIFIHELGHFLLAKWNGVHVHVFSIGMGPYIFSFTYKGTVYALSLIPVGGYVKMMGQDDMNADLGASKNPKDFRNKRPGQRAAILVAGAAFNILLTLGIFTYCYARGIYFPAPRIGNVVPTKPIAKAVLIKKDANGEMKEPANLKPGDTILAVNGKRVKNMMDAALATISTPRGEAVTLEVERNEGSGPDRIIYVSVITEEDKRIGAPGIGLEGGYREKVSLPLGFTTEYYFYIAEKPEESKESSIKNGAAAKTGQFQKNDHLVAVEDRTDKANPIVTRLKGPNDLVNASALSQGKERYIVVERSGKEVAIPVTPKIDEKEKSGDAKFGIMPSEMYRVTAIDEDCDAYKAGLRAGYFVRGFEVPDPNVMPWTSGKLEWFERLEEKKPHTAELNVPSEVPAHRRIFQQDKLAKNYVKAAGVTDAAGIAFDDLKNYTGSMFATLRGLFNGSVGASNLSGPLGIGHSIYLNAHAPFLNSLWWLAYISLCLGVMQLLPIPLLDGFHLLLVILEKMKGKPVSAKAQVACFYFGMVLIGLLFCFVMFNDITRWF